MKLRRSILGLAILAIVIALVGFSATVYLPQYYQAQAYAASDERASSVDKDLVAVNTRFALAIFKELQAEDQNKNIFISPLSISTALAMTYNGAEGSTKDAMAKALQYSSMDVGKMNEGYFNLIGSLENADSQVSLKIGNSIWMEKSFEPKVDSSFTKRITDYYRGEAFTRPFMDPKTVGEINGWISDKTNGKIDKMIDEIDPDMVMFLINAIYFKGDWVKKFDASQTARADFFLPNRSTVKVDMMPTSGTFSYYSGEGFEAVRLPYGRDKIAMYIFLPQEGIPLESLIGNLNQTAFDSFISGFSPPKELDVMLPKFKLEYGIKRLNDVLTKMGMGIAFSGSANFNGMTSADPAELYIGYVDHKAVVEVNEQGTEAAAATVVAMLSSGSAPIRTVFNVNRPFFFVIRDDRSGSILFMGKIVNPLQSSSP
jgi:serpin B